jgi:hypothetical protein
MKPKQNTLTDSRIADSVGMGLSGVDLDISDDELDLLSD